MAEKIKGITIEFRGNTTPLQTAIRTVNGEINKTTKELKSINQALKFNPGSVDLWRQKQEVLTQKVQATTDKLSALKQQQKQMDASGVSKNSEEYRALQREIIETESRLKTFKGQLKEIGNVNLKALSEQLDSVGKKATEMGKNLSMKVTAPLVAVGAVSAKSFAEVDKTMQLTNATMGNGTKEAELLNKAMKEAAANSTFGMSDAATASLNFARAGLKAEEAAAAIAPAMNLAAGEGGELDTVSAGLVATINGFHGSFDEAASYADVFANACNNSALDVNGLSQAMSVAAPVFSAAGYSVNDAALYMGVMANNGIEADKAANSLKTGLARLVSPAKAGAEMMAKLRLYTDEGGSAFENLDGSMKSSVEIQKILHDSFSQLSESEQIAAASAIFGKNQMAPWLALINTAPGDVNALNEALMTEGTTTEMATAMMSGFGGSLEKLKSSVDVAKTSLGEALAPAILMVANGIQKLIDWFNSLTPKAQSMIAMVGVAVAAIGPLLIVFGKLATGVSAVIKVVNLASTAFSAAGGVMSLLSSGPLIAIVAAIAAVIAIGVLLYKNWDKIKETAQKVGEKIKSVWQSVKDAVGGLMESMRNGIETAWNGIVIAIQRAGEYIWDAITWPFREAWNTITGIVDWIRSLFPINLGNLFSGIKLPHFNIEWGQIEFGKWTIDYPYGFNVEWYDKGGIFDHPSVIGVGENRPEFVGALDDLRKIVREESGTGEITINVYATPGMNEEELARKIEQRLVALQKQRSLAYGGI